MHTAGYYGKSVYAEYSVLSMTVAAEHPRRGNIWVSTGILSYLQNTEGGCRLVPTVNINFRTEEARQRGMVVILLACMLA